MFRCENCGRKFEEPSRGFNPYPDFGGEVTMHCPECGAPEMFYKIEEDEDDE